MNPRWRLRASALTLTFAIAALVDPADAAVPPPTAPQPTVKSVLVISVDGLNPEAIRILGPTGAPNFYRLMAEGASTLNARTVYEKTETLPNHTSMVTGRPVDIARGGHGIDFNVDNGTTVAQNATHRVRSVFSKVHNKLGRTALFVSKPKFELLHRSWPNSIDRYVYQTDNDALTTIVIKDLKKKRRFRLLHLSAPDGAGHASGYMSADYLEKVQATDRRLGRVMRKIDRTKRLRKNLMLVITTDHGGVTTTHTDATQYGNYRIPFFAWGRGVTSSDLYDINPAYADPGVARPTYSGTQPIRNADIANLATSLLGLGPVKGSLVGQQQRLTVYAD